MTRDPSDLQGLLNRARKIVKRDAEETDPRIECARPIRIVRKAMQREMLAQGERAAIGDDLIDDPARPAAGQRVRQFHVDLRVVRETAREIAIDSGAVARDGIVALLA